MQWSSDEVRAAQCDPTGIFKLVGVVQSGKVSKMVNSSAAFLRMRLTW
jgi:hypothetical protein